MKNTKGFTLIELLVVVLIIGILAAMALPQYFKAVEKSKTAEAIQVLGTLAQAEQRYYLIHDTYSTSYEGLDVEFPDYQGSMASGSELQTNNYKITLHNGTLENGYAVASRTNPKTKATGGYKIFKCFGNGKIFCSGDASNSRISCTGLGLETGTEAKCAEGQASSF